MNLTEGFNVVDDVGWPLLDFFSSEFFSFLSSFFFFFFCKIWGAYYL